MKVDNILRRIGFYIVTIVLLVSARAEAALHLELTQGVNSAIPVALITFAGDKSDVADDESLSNIIKNDLQNSGEFRVKTSNISSGLSDINFGFWRKQNVNAVITGRIEKNILGEYKVSFQLIDVYDQSSNASKALPPEAMLLNKLFTVKKTGLRVLAHHISDLIYQKLTGTRGIFSTKIAYVLAKKSVDNQPVYLLNVADADGYNSQTLLQSTQPIMSPTWTHDGKDIAYVSFEGHHASIYLQQLTTGKREKISEFPGINGAPAFSPDGKQMALVLSKTGNPKVYVINLATHALTQITHGYAIDTEPVWSSDGNMLYFTSNRAGGPQIFAYDFKSKQVSRVTFDGNYNARACLAPDGKSLVMIHRDSGLFGIAKLDLNTGRTMVLTASGVDESPSLAPNGKMVLYGTQFAGRSVLAVVAVDGQVKLRLPAQEGDVQDPAWSPFLG